MGQLEQARKSTGGDRTITELYQYDIKEYHGLTKLITNVDFSRGVLKDFFGNCRKILFTLQGTKVVITRRIPGCVGLCDCLDWLDGIETDEST